FLEIITSLSYHRIASTYFLVVSFIDCLSRALKISSMACIYSAGLMFISVWVVTISLPVYCAGPPLPALKKSTVCCFIRALRLIDVLYKSGIYGRVFHVGINSVVNQHFNTLYTPPGVQIVFPA